jgi:hypothetical protein
MEKNISVKDTFNLEGFLRSCYKQGVRLYSALGEPADGHVERSAGVLKVILDVESAEKMLIIDNTVPLFDDGQPSPAKVPESVSPRQIRLAMLQSGMILTAIDDLINSMPEPDKTIVRVNWDYAIEISRADPLIENMGALLGLTSDQIDALFILAENL